jgi:methylphosphotriester-DNA--protein-cysteine methyltransferase
MREEMQLLCERAVSLLSSNPHLTLQEIAHLIGTDRHKIERALKEHSGIIFRELKKQVLLKHALTLLEEHPSSRLKEIAADVGLTPNHLSYFIRSMTGCSATELRRHKS